MTWEQLIARLQSWPDASEAESPSEDLVETAIAVAENLQSSGSTSFDDISYNNGICFEKHIKDKNLSIILELSKDKSLMLKVFCDRKLIYKFDMSLEEHYEDNIP